MKKKLYITPQTTIYMVRTEHAFMQASDNSITFPQEEIEEGGDQYLAW